MAIDTHCHLSIRFEPEEVPDVLLNAKKNSVHGVILVGYSPLHNQSVLQTITQLISDRNNYPLLAGTVGIHPHEADKFNQNDVEGLRDYLDSPYIIAVGETGLDFYRDYADRKNQENLFRAHVNLASELAYPLVIHSRNAFANTMDILDAAKLPESPGVFHCYGYGPDELERILAKGFYISFAGVVTYPKSEKLQEACRRTPLNRILVETDSPFQVPQKAKNRNVRRNEPSHVIEVAEKVAFLKNLSYATVAAQLMVNVVECFPKLKKLAPWSEALGGIERIEC